jgi:PAB-dependent poly(A)-specific ribonuclease subunit 3
VLLTSSGRVRIGSLGLADSLAAPPSSRDELQQQQREDLAALGLLLLTLTCVGSGLRPSLDNCMANFSMDLTRIISALLASPEGGGIGSWRGLAAALGERLFMGLDSAQLYADALLGELGTEVDNGRLLRLCARLSAVTERAEHEGDPQWSETGDRYLLKLFRDFVFHQMDEEGRPILDWGHMVEALNKLDAAVPEQVMLLSRDEMSMLVVSYADVARCLRAAYSELQARCVVPR